MATNAVRMEFTGTQLGALFFTVDGVQYRGSASVTDKYIDADPAHVETLEKTGMWKKVEQPKAAAKTEAKTETKEDRKQ